MGVLIISWNCINFKANFIENNLSNKSLNEVPDSSVCESINEISNQEIEAFKKEIKLQLTDIDYETYIKQFWVGLLEGDGTITVSAPGPNHVKVRFIISIKNLRENVFMLLLIQQVLGGTVKIERKAQYVTWIAIKKDLIQSLFKLLEEYPLLTTHKQCQLKFAIFILFYISNGINRNIKSKFLFTEKSFSTCVPFNISESGNTPTQITSLNPWFVTGFSDGESTFGISIYKKSASKLGWDVLVYFQLGLHKKDRVVLEKIKSYFKVGKIYEQDIDVYKVQSVKDLKGIIDHFDKYPLITQKRADYELWKQVVEIVKNKEHLTLKGLQKIVAIRASINLGLSDKLKTAFPEIVPFNRPIISGQKIPNPYWLSGFTSAEGCFWIYIFKSTTTKTGMAVNLIFSISQHARDEQLIKSFIEYFGCGKFYLNKEAVYIRVTKFSDIYDKIIPFFKKYPIMGVKALDFQDFCEVAHMMKDKNHLNKQGLDLIQKIKARMNTKR